MKILKVILVALLPLLVAGCSVCEKNERNTAAQYYESLFQDGAVNIAGLNLFFTRMPKGGDIHHHYTGSIYAETYLEWVARNGWWIDSCTLKILTKAEEASCEALTVSKLEKNSLLYRRLLTLWSDKDYKNHYHEQPAPDSNFFNTFGYFGMVSGSYMPEGLNILKQRAIHENVSYIETMLARVPVSSSDYFNKKEIDQWINDLRAAESQEQANAVFERITAALSANSDFEEKVNGYVAKVEANHQGIDSNDFIMRFQTYAARVGDPLQVFLQLYSGFIAADKSPLIVGVNIVAPENNVVAIADYTLHMRMFNYLHGRYPAVHRALHAGELTLGMVRPADMLFHIREALEIAAAERIGHGVDLPYESHSVELLAALKKADTAIEINLTSNQFILGVAGMEHPYTLYSEYGVPLVISTDDSGVSRNNLSNEYMLLASRYHPSYETIKQYVYNSIEYSFLATVDKVNARRVLDGKFAVFEKEMSALAGELNQKSCR